MKQLLDEKVLLELLEMAKSASQKAKLISDLATEIDEKWQRKLEEMQAMQLQHTQSQEK